MRKLGCLAVVRNGIHRFLYREVYFHHFRSNVYEKKAIQFELMAQWPVGKKDQTVLASGLHHKGAKSEGPAVATVPRHKEVPGQPAVASLHHYEVQEEVPGRLPPLAAQKSSKPEVPRQPPPVPKKTLVIRDWILDRKGQNG